MKRTIAGLASAGEPLIQEAIAALRVYHQAQAKGSPAAEVERLRLVAESAFQAVTDYQLYASGQISITKH
ncbi:hypothetical protein [Pseudomonas cremoricolorata]|uniref:hypothetical protein n=1 Tax=Pseudomonas cremoricolorata TaxID=157783 RepID=UPI00048BC78D|nr:hypothetical protein [Pseudomonas cremoricolorata]